MYALFGEEQFYLSIGGCLFINGRRHRIDCRYLWRSKLVEGPERAGKVSEINDMW